MFLTLPLSLPSTEQWRGISNSWLANLTEALYQNNWVNEIRMRRIKNNVSLWTQSPHNYKQKNSCKVLHFCTINMSAFNPVVHTGGGVLYWDRVIPNWGFPQCHIGFRGKPKYLCILYLLFSNYTSDHYYETWIWNKIILIWKGLEYALHQQWPLTTLKQKQANDKFRLNSPVVVNPKLCHVWLYFQQALPPFKLQQLKWVLG